MSDEFHGDETLLTSHETPSFSLLVILAKVMVFNVIKLFMKLPLRLALDLIWVNLDEIYYSNLQSKIRRTKYDLIRKLII